MRALLLCITLTVMSALPARAADILILQSQRGAAYGEALRGFHAASRESYQTVVLSDYAEVDVERLVKEERPRAVLVLGDQALAAARKVREVPVVSVLSLALNVRGEAADNIGGISMFADPQHYLKLFGSLGLKKVGVLYDPARTGRYLKRALHESKQTGINLVAEPVSDCREVQGRLGKLKGSVEALWMLPDSTVSTTVNMEAFLLFSVDNDVPIVTFSSHYLKYGAAASLDLDYFDMGVQAAEMVVSLRGNGRVTTVHPRKTVLHTNDSVIRRLGKKVSKN